MRRANMGMTISVAVLWTSAAAAQDMPRPAAPPPPTAAPAGQSARPGDAPGPRREFRDAQGRPLPPEVQRQLEERLRANPPAAGSPTAATSPATPGGDILVTGERPRGAVIGDVPAERSFDAISVRAFGATDIGELLDTVAPQLRSNRGRDDAGPVTLLNGRRVSGFAEIARIPTEAIERMDVFPEELALRYGFRADQKVVNIVTFPNFRSTVAQATALAATEGGTATGGTSGDQLILRGDSRLGIGATFNRTAALLESDRDLLQPGGAAETAGLRTLLPRVERLALNGVVAAPLTPGIGASLNAQFEASDLAALLGLDTAGRGIGRDTRNRRGRIGTVFDGRVGRWLWSLTGGYDRTAVDVLTDNRDPGGRPERARSINEAAEADIVASGPLFTLPAGPVSASIGGGASARGFRGSSVRDDAVDRSRLSRERIVARGNLDLPITRDGTAIIGSLAANIAGQVEQLSDAGTLTTVGGGLTWSPVSAVDVVGSLTREEGAPTVEQLGAPTIVTPAFRSFDFATGQSVDVPRIFGGNAGLVPDTRRVLRVGLNVTPLPRVDLALSLDYVDTRTADPIAAFPILTPALEAAFPNRFLRDGDGRLSAIDARPLNFARSTLRQLRSGISFSRPLGDPAAGLPPGAVIQQTRSFASPEEAQAWVRRRYPGSTIVMSDPEPGTPAARRGETLRSRFYINLFHNWTLTDTVTLVEGDAALDRLDGFATDLRGGRHRHEIEFQVGAFKAGIGGRLGVNWQSATRIDGLGGTGDLLFPAFGRLDLTLFLNPADRMGGTRAPEWVKRTRVTLNVTNALNTRPSVRDRDGATPIAFQPALLDPLGRTVSLTLRKAF